MDITRKDIEDEPNYKKLQAIGRAFRKEGHKLVLNAPEDDLKARLLNIFDNHYVSEDVAEEIEEAISEVDDPEPAVIILPVTDEQLENPPEELVPEVDTPKEKLYIAPRFYKDWASGWSFTPGMDEPKALPDTLTPGLENALKTKKIIPYEG